MSNPLTLQFAGRVLEIATEAKISKAFDASRMPGIPHPPYEPCKAVWDTGAMSTVITPTLASKLGLKSLGLVKMQHANGVSLVNTYMINLLLPNKMEVHSLYVMEGAMADTDMLIGMIRWQFPWKGWRHWQLVQFYDWAKVTDEDDIYTAEQDESLGLGLRYRWQFLTFRLDYAFKKNLGHWNMESFHLGRFAFDLSHTF